MKIKPIQIGLVIAMGVNGIANAAEVNPCTPLLLQANFSKLESDSAYRYHFANAIDEKTYSNFDEGFKAQLGKIGLSLESMREIRAEKKSRTTIHASSNESLSLITISPNKTALIEYGKCISRTAEAGHLSTTTTGDPQGLDFLITIHWKPPQELGAAGIKLEGAGALAGKLNDMQSYGEKTLYVSRSSNKSSIIGAINGRTGNRQYSTNIVIPAWEDVPLQSFPVFLSKLTPQRCISRTDNKCISNAGEVITYPTRGSSGVAVFAIPAGAIRFSADVSHNDPGNCKAAGNWRAEVYQDGILSDHWNMKDTPSRQISIKITPGARTIELRTPDNDNNEWCDDPVWRSAAFY